MLRRAVGMGFWLFLASACQHRGIGAEFPVSYEETSGPSVPFRLVKSSRPLETLEVPLDADVRILIEGTPAPDSVTEASIQVIRKDTGDAVEVQRFWDKATLILRPVRKFLSHETAGTGRSHWSGLRPDTPYEVVLLEELRDPSGKRIEPAGKRWPFRTAPLDYGIHWLDADGSFAKGSAHGLPPFVDLEKPIVLYVHGWQPHATEQDFWRENPFSYGSAHFGLPDALQTWRKSGWNVAIFFWSQWADEPEVKDAQAKIWRGDSRAAGREGEKVGLRFRGRGGNFRSYASRNSVAQLFLEDYLSQLSTYRGSSIRLVGHSLGAQLSTAFLERLDAAMESGRARPNLHPRRFALLDPFWSKGGLPELGGKSPGTLCAEILRKAIEKHGLVVEQFKSSAVGGHLAGDENLSVRELTAFSRLWAKFIPLPDQVSRHLWSYVWYFDSLRRPVPTRDGGHLGAAASDEEVRREMNFKKDPPFLFSSVGTGNETPSVDDDLFEREEGVRTW